MMSQQLETIINNAVKRANILKHEYLTLENIMLSMIDDNHVVRVLSDCGANLEILKDELTSFLKDEQNFSILTEEQIQEISQRQFVDEELRNLARQNGIIYQPEISLALQRVIQRAALHVQSSGKKQIMAHNILVAMFQERESFALHLLEKQGINRLKVIDVIAHDLDKPVNSSFHEISSSEEQMGNVESERSKSKLDEFAINLNKMAQDGKLDPLIGRVDELERIVQVLCRRRKNNPLLVGDAGVGKTAMAEGLAWSIVNNQIPKVLENAEVYSLDLAALLAGAKFRGDFEQRFKMVLKDLQKLHEKGITPILFIDEIHTIMGAGATTGGAMDASNLLKPYLGQGDLRCLGSTTHEEYRKFIEKDPAFNRRFQKIDIDEPSVEDTYKILQGLKDKFEKHHNVKYPSATLKSAVDLAVKHLPDRRLPDKAIDIIDEAGAFLQLLPQEKRKKSLTVKDIEETISKMAKIPKKHVATDELSRLKNLKMNLKMLIFGQDEAVSKVADTVLLSRSGLGNPLKPMASFLFTGPTGVGKTELARQLAFEMGIGFERFDMSEYMEKHSVAKLIGAPPGYIGYDKGGILTDAIKKSPYCVLLLDEIEKAHPDIFNILLQVMDHGALTDAHGRQTDFKNVILIMTTNAGAKEMEAGAIGFSSTSGLSSTKRDQALKNFFTPEFRNRIDGIIHFNKLDRDTILNVVDKFVSMLKDKLLAKKVEITVTQKAREAIANQGFDPQMGARPLERFINENLAKPLGLEILFGKLAKGGEATIDWQETDKKFIFKY